MKAVVLSRVSSEEQTKGFSPEAQSDNCLQYCKSKNFEVIYHAQFDESASYMSKKGRREKFWECLNIIKKESKHSKEAVALPTMHSIMFTLSESMPEKVPRKLAIKVLCSKCRKDT